MGDFLYRQYEERDDEVEGVQSTMWVLATLGLVALIVGGLLVWWAL